MWKLISVFLLVLLAARFAAQDTAGPEAEQARILTLENAWNQSVQQKDVSALRMLLAPDLIYVDYDGTLMNKVEYLASVQSLALHPVRIVNESMNIHFYGMVAVVTGVCRESGLKNGKPYALLERFTDTWVRAITGWPWPASLH
jgi:ketosteroid isomerase-like protein